MKKYYFLFLILFTIPSCNYLEERSVPHIKTLHPSEGNKITTIAILPFQNKTGKEGIEDTLRTCFFTNLSMKGFELLKIEEVDERLNLAELNANNIDKEDIYKMGKIVKADALLYGAVTKCCKKHFGVYSQVTIGTEVKLVDAKSYKTIWQVNHTETTHGGSVPVSPLSIPEAVIESSINVREKVFKDTADRLAKKIIAGIPGKNFNSPLNAHVISLKNTGISTEVCYRVQDNDTLSGISTKFYDTAAREIEISNANNLVSGETLRAGQELIIPDIPVLKDIEEAQHIDKSIHKKTVYRVKWGDNLYEMASKVFHDGNKWTIIYDANKQEIGNVNDLPVGQVLLIPLCITRVNSF